MMKSSIFIPKTINVGYQTRNDTYTKRLAYVIYYDESGKLRKETSWNSWRDNKIPNDEFENVPTEGFVLNKKVGDYDSGWNHRHAYCRIYDPRNFEFEITFENLLYILENTSSIKGKGLEGEFVYGWDGKDLVLIPVASPDYKQIKEYNDILHNKETIKAKDLIIGATYLDKDNKEYVYMGKFDHYDYGYGYRGKGYKSYRAMVNDNPNYSSCEYTYVDGQNQGKKLFFCTKPSYTDEKYDFVVMSSISKKFIKCIDTNCHSEYSNMFDWLESSTKYSPIDKSKTEYIDMSIEDVLGKMKSSNYAHEAKCYDSDGEVYEIKEIKIGDKWTNTYVCHKRQNGEHYFNLIDERFEYEAIKDQSYWGGITIRKKMIPTSLEHIFEVIQPKYSNLYLVNGKYYCSKLKEKNYE